MTCMRIAKMTNKATWTLKRISVGAGERWVSSGEYGLAYEEYRR